MAEKSLFSLQSMGQMQNGFTKEGSLKRFPELMDDQEAGVLGEGTEMIIVENTGEAGAEVGRGMSVTSTGRVNMVIGTGAGVIVRAQTMIDTVAGDGT